MFLPVFEMEDIEAGSVLDCGALRLLILALCFQIYISFFKVKLTCVSLSVKQVTDGQKLHLK